MVMIVMVLGTVSNLILHDNGYLSISQSFVRFVCMRCDGCPNRG